MGSPRRATYADLDRTPEGDGNVYELLDGVLYSSPRPKWIHTLVQQVLSEMLRDALRAASGELPVRWRIFQEPELRLTGDAFVPDLAAWRTPVPLPAAHGYMTTVPPWVSEVLSPSNLQQDWSRKVPAYFRHGVQHVWLVDARQRELHVLERGGTGTRHAGDVLVRPAPFGVLLNLADLWRELPTEH
jgi:Uma2 family endonuclease